jgi:isoquinoline 1-oxidoreductase beta subunit
MADLDLDPAGSALGEFDELDGAADGGGVSRRRFIGYLMAGPVLIAGARFAVAPGSAAAAAPGVDPTTQLPVDVFDLSDLLTAAAASTFGVLTVRVNPNGRVAFALPRAEVGQGITTAFAIMIADEVGVPLSDVDVVLADADPALLYNQLTGGSNSVHCLYMPVRMAAATARGQLTRAAADRYGASPADYTILDGILSGPGGVSTPIGSLSKLAAVAKPARVHAELKPDSALRLIGTAQPRIDAHEIVTGQKVFAMDIEIPNALPTMLCRPPTINGVALSVANLSAVKGMPGVTDVKIVPPAKFVPGGVAVRARTFGQCIDAVNALKVKWGPGTAEGKSAASVAADLAAHEVPMGQPTAGAQDLIDETFTFHFRPGDALETNCAVADVRPNGAEIWSSLKSPIWAQEQIAHQVGLSTNQVKVHVTQGGGSFGRHLFCDAAFEAALVSAILGKPVKLMWHRTDNFRQGRVHPMTRSRVRMALAGGHVVAYDQRHTGVPTDFTQGLGEIITANAATIPGGNFAGFSEAIFLLTANVPYNFGPVTQLLEEIYSYNTFNTSSVRNVYSPDLATATELMADQAGLKLGLDPLAFRQKYIRDPRMLAVVNKLGEVGNWGRSMPAGTAQGIGIHKEYKGAAACLAEIDCRPATVNRKVPNGYTGPRVTRMVFVIDVGTPINKMGLGAQMMGGMMDGMAQALTYSMHLEDGHFLEGSWDNAYYTRQWNVPPEMEFVVMPANGNPPGGAGEFACGTSMAAVACAYARATGTLPTTFPINYDQPLGFAPYPFEPPLPQSPTNGLRLKGKPTAV